MRLNAFYLKSIGHESSPLKAFDVKQQRHNTIREILSRTPVNSQDELRRRLAERGFHVTQATLSRDMHELHLYKGPGGYTVAGNGAAEDDQLPGIRDVMRSFGLEVRQASNLVVVITRTGGAQPVAAGLDYEDWPEVVGTIAGDDTVLAICGSNPQAKSLRTKIEALLG